MSLASLIPIGYFVYIFIVQDKEQIQLFWIMAIYSLFLLVLGIIPYLAKKQLLKRYDLPEKFKDDYRSSDFDEKIKKNRFTRMAYGLGIFNLCSLWFIYKTPFIFLWIILIIIAIIPIEKVEKI